MDIDDETDDNNNETDDNNNETDDNQKKRAKYTPKNNTHQSMFVAYAGNVLDQTLLRVLAGFVNHIRSGPLIWFLCQYSKHANVQEKQKNAASKLLQQTIHAGFQKVESPEKEFNTLIMNCNRFLKTARNGIITSIAAWGDTTAEILANEWLRLNSLEMDKQIPNVEIRWISREVKSGEWVVWDGIHSVKKGQSGKNGENNVRTVIYTNFKNKVQMDEIAAAHQDGWEGLQKSVSDLMPPKKARKSNIANGEAASGAQGTTRNQAAEASLKPEYEGWASWDSLYLPYANKNCMWNGPNASVNLELIKDVKDVNGESAQSQLEEFGITVVPVIPPEESKLFAEALHYYIAKLHAEDPKRSGYGMNLTIDSGIENMNMLFDTEKRYAAWKRGDWRHPNSPHFLNAFTTKYVDKKYKLNGTNNLEKYVARGTSGVTKSSCMFALHQMPVPSEKLLQIWRSLYAQNKDDLMWLERCSVRTKSSHALGPHSDNPVISKEFMEIYAKLLSRKRKFA